MKKIVAILALCLTFLFCAIGFAACDESSVNWHDEQILSIYNTYVTYAEENGETALSYEEWIERVKGVDGKDGINGIDGKDGVSVVKVEKTNVVGLVDTYTITYSDGSTTSFLITNGAKGDTGKSAYEIWLDNGHEGSEADFLEWLKGDNGKIPVMRYDEETGYIQWKYTDEGDDAWRNLVNIEQGNNSSTPVDEQGWRNAFSTMEYSNLTMIINTQNNGEEELETNKIYISEDGMYVSKANGAYLGYYMKNQDGTFDNYAYFEEEQTNFAAARQWTKLYNDSSLYYDFEVEELWVFDFSESFDAFVYDEAKDAYVCDKEISSSIFVMCEGEKYPISEITVKSAEITISDGKLVKINCNFTMENHAGVCDVSVSIYDIGTTVVSVPADVLENAVEQPAPIYN